MNTNPTINNLPRISQYTVISTLGKSKFETFKVIAEKDPKTIFAIKCFAKSNKIKNPKVFFDRESRAYSKLNHKNIIKMFESVEYEKYPNTPDASRVSALVLEYASKKTLFEYVAKTGSFCEDMTRMIFKSILFGVEHINQNGLAHLDLKLDNIMFSEDYTLKICDFDAARPSHEIIKGERAGTPGYCAPEIFTKQAFIPAKADIFSLGVVLFIICSNRSPFNQALADDVLYNLIKNEAYEEFWEIWEEKGGLYFCVSLKNLLNSMWNFDFNKRPCLSDIMKSEWINIGKEDKEFYLRNMKERFTKIA